MNPVDPTALSFHKRWFLLGSLSLLISSVLFALVAYAISASYAPDLRSIIAEARELLVVRGFKPEPQERLLYLSGIVLMPMFLYLSSLIIGRLTKGLPDDLVSRCYSGMVPLVALGIVFIVCFTLYQQSGPLQPSEECSFHFYFNKSILYVFPYVYGLLCLPLIVAVIFVCSYGVLYKCASLVSNIVAFALIMLLFLMNVFDYNGPIHENHFNAVFFSVVRICQGNILLLDINNQYGLYAFFIAPLLSILGVNVLNFTIIMASLIALSYVFIWLFLSRVVTNPWLRLLGFVSVVFLGYLSPKLITQDAYFQYHPIRILFPSLLLYVVSLYIKSPTTLLYYLGFVLCSIGVLWNFDTGIIVFIAWHVILCYRELFVTNIRTICFQCFRHVIIGGTILIITIVLYIVYVYIMRGALPEITRLLMATKVFALYGYMMLPMPLFHPWNLIVLVYVTGLLWGIMTLIFNQDNYRADMVIAVTVLGLGIFSYYQGRSHSWNLCSSAYPALILITVFADEFLDNIEKYGKQLFHNIPLLMICLFVLGISLPSIPVNSKEIIDYVDKRLGALSKDNSELAHNIDFLKKHVVAGEKLIIMSAHQGIYHAETKTESPADFPGLIEVFYGKDLHKILNVLQDNTETKVVYDTRISRGVCPGLPQIDRVLRETYMVLSVSDDEAMVLLSKKKL